MELIKRNIHMERTRSDAAMQFALEDDLNIPDNKPDVNMLYLQRAEAVIDEVRPGNDMAQIRGRLKYQLLYQTNESGGSLVPLEGSIPFEEKLNMEGVTAQDTVTATGQVEDLTVGIINSRKLHIQSLLTLQACVEELYDVEAPIGIHGEEPVEYRKVTMPLTQVAIDKKDVVRLREEVTLPSGYPNIYQILWCRVSLGDVECKVQDGQLAMQGDVQLGVLYEGEGEDHPVRAYETTVPFNETLECHGSREGMIPDIGYVVSQQEIAVRPDLDGEERNIGMELALDTDIRMYEEEETELVTDLYGVRNEVETAAEPVTVRQLLSKVTGKTKVTDRIRIENDSEPILQLLYSEGELDQPQWQVVENGMQLEGEMTVKVLYITGDDNVPYSSVEAQIPYQYTLEVPGIRPEDVGSVQARLEQLQVSMLDGEELDVKAILSFDTTVFRGIPMEFIRQVEISELDAAKRNSLPGIVVYTVKPGDSLWSIGKKYYVSVDALKEWNGLTGDDLMIGQKLLIVKGQ